MSSAKPASPAHSDDFVDDEALVSSGPEVSDDDDVLVPNTPPDRAPVCGQCTVRDDVWALVVRCYQELEVELDDYDAAAADAGTELVRMMERVELHDAPLRVLRRAAYIDVCRLRTALIALGGAYGEDDWERREAYRLKSCYNSMYQTLETMREHQAARKFYAKTLRDELGAVHTSFMVMNLRSESRSLSDRELVFRARLALILMSNSSAIEPACLRDFFLAEVPILRSAVNALVARLTWEQSCEHNF
jgi:hypothetical protein